MRRSESPKSGRLDFKINVRLLFLHQNIIFNETIDPYLKGSGFRENDTP